MERVISWSSFEEERGTNPALAFWLTRAPEERIAEVERLRGEYSSVFRRDDRMDVHTDFADLCNLLNTARVEFLIVGGYAVAFHGAPRFTGDLDVLVRPEIEQIARMLQAVRTFGFPAEDVSPEYILERQKILQLGRIPVQIHIMTAISGLSWDEAWASREPGNYGNVPVFYIGRQALITNKMATGRAKDLADIEALG
jgi:hypothetical protein